MSKYIKPPRSSEVSWRLGPPPEVGWWPASCTGGVDILRFWNGDGWSEFAYHAEMSKELIPPIEKMNFINTQFLKWTDRWWLK